MRALSEPVPYICAINVEEIWRGTREDEQGHVGRLLRSLRLAPLGFAEGAQAGRWRRDFAAEGITLSQADCLIAAAALGAGTAFRDRKPEALPHARARRRALAGQRLSGQVGPRPERSLVEHPGCRQDSDVQPESVVYREELTAMLFAIADRTATSGRSAICSRRSTVAKKSYQKMTPDERERQLANQQRLERVIEKRLEQDGTTREEIWRQLGLPDQRTR